MAALSLINAYIEINSVDMSTDIRKVTLPPEVEDLETTTFGGGGYRSRIGGLKDWELELEFVQDFAASQVDATLWPLLGTVVPVVIRPTSSAVGTSNPQYSGSVLVKDYPPLDAEVGGLVTVSVTWPGAGTLTRATS